jgi:hypothetical protein
MEQEALIDIILNDIKEVHALVNTFKGKNEINAAFINLTRTKIANIREELSLLEQLNQEKKSQTLTESSLTSVGLSASSSLDDSAIAESSSRFAEGESFSDTKVEPTIETQTIEINKASASATISEEIVQVTTSPSTESDDKEIALKEKAPIQKTETSEDKTEKIATPEHHTRPLAESNVNETLETAKKQTGSQHQVISSQNTESAILTKAAILGEVINKDSSSLNEAMANRKESVEDIRQIGKPVDDVRKAFGLNDRFYFQRELFSNNADLFNQTLDQINHMDSYQSAINFLQSNYNWGADNEASESFYKSIKRRFI